MFKKINTIIKRIKAELEKNKKEKEQRKKEVYLSDFHPGKIIPSCTHQCTCKCHEDDSIIHIASCCEQCEKCGKNITAGLMSEHLRVCHNIEFKCPHCDTRDNGFYDYDGDIHGPTCRVFRCKCGRYFDEPCQGDTGISRS